MKDKHDDVVVETDGSEELHQDDLDDASGKTAKLKKELDAMRKEKQEYLDGWQRAKADYVNALKRFEEEKKGAVALGMGMAAGAFIPAIDSLARAEAVGEVPDAFKGIAKQLHEAVTALGMEQYGRIGDAFDPSLHEALGQEPTSEKEKDDTIIQILEPGWKGREGVIRPAKVRVLHYEG